jgi:hypothetical protein
MTIVKHAFIICLNIRVSAHHAWVEKQNLSESSIAHLKAPII